MAAQETGKQRASRIPLDYYKRPDRLERWKRRLLVIAPLLALAWWGGSWLRSDQGRRHYSRGPLAAVHAAWDDQCDACHVSFAPLASEAWLGSWLGTASTGAQRCTNCHAGAIHHQNADDTTSCSGCHRDHRGREASLTRLADGDCTSCHADLNHHVKAGMQTSFVNASRFSDNQHPQFKIFREQNPPEDPGKLKFNHKRHMTAGMDCGYNLVKITSLAERERYRQAQENRDDKALVQLRCDSCHRLDASHVDVARDQPGGLAVSSALPARSQGAYMLPITYENQCAACHPLTIERKVPDEPASGLVSVRHLLPPAELHEYLEGVYANQLLQDNVKLFEQFIPVRPLPGKLPARETEEAKTLIAGKVAEAERQLYRGKKTCAECHHLVFDEDKVVPKTVMATNVPKVWFQHALFDHSAHRAVACRSCHEQAYPDSPNASIQSKDVMLPEISNCLKCHGPSSHSGSEVRGGARSDCTECHRYHNGDNPVAGIGASARGVLPEDKLDIQQFLSGGVKK